MQSGGRTQRSTGLADDPPEGGPHPGGGERGARQAPGVLEQEGGAAEGEPGSSFPPKLSSNRSPNICRRLLPQFVTSSCCLCCLLAPANLQRKGVVLVHPGAGGGAELLRGRAVHALQQDDRAAQLQPVRPHPQVQ